MSAELVEFINMKTSSSQMALHAARVQIYIRHLALMDYIAAAESGETDHSILKKWN